MMQFDPVMADLAALRERRLATPDPGARPIIRSITPDDGPALTEMALRCSPDSIRHRFHAPLTGAEPSRLTALLRGRGAIITLVADVDGAVVGIATLHRSGRGAAEVAVLVEDRWQAGGVGTRLLSHLMKRAAQHGIRTVDADVQREQGFLIDRLLRGVPDAAASFDGPVATLHLPVGPAS